ncbi:MAG TPA: hypothetical protein VJM31_17820 [Vicinamibacterales bacterium]|nr:hypothetical protein [Vicinamibacterales bacterium]
MKLHALNIWLVATLQVFGAMQVRGQGVAHSFNGYTFSLELPRGFKLEAEISPNPSFRTFGFTGQARSDGTRTLIQVSLVDLRKTEERPSLDQFTRTMLEGVQRRRSEWQETQSQVEVAGDVPPECDPVVHVTGTSVNNS